MVYFEFVSFHKMIRKSKALHYLQSIIIIIVGVVVAVVVVVNRFI